MVAQKVDYSAAPTAAHSAASWAGLTADKWEHHWVVLRAETMVEPMAGHLVRHLVGHLAETWVAQMAA